jgi:hypothetical protein
MTEILGHLSGKRIKNKTVTFWKHQATYLIGQSAEGTHWLPPAGESSFSDIALDKYIALLLVG